MCTVNATKLMCIVYAKGINVHSLCSREMGLMHTVYAKGIHVHSFFRVIVVHNLCQEIYSL